MLTTMKNRQRQTDEKQTLQLDHRAKIVDLLEAYVRHQPQSPLILTFLQPLCRAIIEGETNKSSPNYLNKLRAFLHHKVIKVTNVYPPQTPKAQKKRKRSATPSKKEKKEPRADTPKKK